MVVASAFTQSVAMAEDGYGHYEGSMYSFAQAVELTRCDLEAQSLNVSGSAPTAAGDHSEKALAPVGGGFVVVKEVNDTSIIKFLLWPEDKPNYTTFNVERGTTQPKLWCVPKATAVQTTRVYYSKQRLFSLPDLAFGVLVVPVKVRPGWGKSDASLTTDFSLGTAIDLSWQVANHAKFELHVPLFVAVGSATVKASESKLTEDTDKPTFSFGSGIGFSGEGAGAAILFGIDLVNDNDTIQWEWQNELWIGFSIGTSFGLTSSSTKEQ